MCFRYIIFMPEKGGSSIPEDQLSGCDPYSHRSICPTSKTDLGAMLGHLQSNKGTSICGPGNTKSRGHVAPWQLASKVARLPAAVSVPGRPRIGTKSVDLSLDISDASVSLQRGGSPDLLPLQILRNIRMAHKTNWRKGHAGHMQRRHSMS